MSKNIPQGYPHKLEDKDLSKKIAEFQTIASDRARSKTTVIDGHWEKLVDLGINEMMLRNLENQI